MKTNNTKREEQQKNFNPGWQEAWPVKCNKQCCFSSDCGNIKCSSCGISIANPAPPRIRYTCKEQVPVENEEGGG